MAEVATIKPYKWRAMSVFELAVANAITHEDMRSAAQTAARLSHWFLQPVGDNQVTESITRMHAQGWITTFGQRFSDWHLTPEGIDTVSTLTGGSIRMIDRQQGLIKASILMGLVNNSKEPS
jgi:hypothetical protein